MYGFAWGFLPNASLESYLLQNWFTGRPAYDAVFINSLSNSTQVGLIYMRLSCHTWCSSCCCASLFLRLLLLLFDLFSSCRLLSVLNLPWYVSWLLRLLGLLCAPQVINQKWPQESRPYVMNLSKYILGMEGLEPSTSRLSGVYSGPYVVCLGGATAVCLYKAALLDSVSLIPYSPQSGKAVLDCLLP